jgi:hypothetical protein
VSFMGMNSSIERFNGQHDSLEFPSVSLGEERALFEVLVPRLRAYAVAWEVAQVSRPAVAWASTPCRIDD